MTLSEWLQQLMPTTIEGVVQAAALCGVITWALVAWICVRADAAGHPLTPGWKFALANFMAFATAGGAYALAVKLSPTLELSLEGVVYAFAVGFTTSQGLHWGSEGAESLGKAIKGAFQKQPQDASYVWFQEQLMALKAEVEAQKSFNASVASQDTVSVTPAKNGVHKPEPNGDAA